jgi:histidyl-tRNA synthetase
MNLQPSRGTRDFLPVDKIRREYVLNIVERVFRKYGFDPIETPAFESWDVLSAKGGGGEAVKNEIYYFKDKGDRELGLRFDLTVPVGRVVAANPNLPKPFKRYQIGRVWRYDRPQAGRFREFWQADIDTLGSSDPLADAEVLAATGEAFKELGFKDYTIRINNRKILDGLMQRAGISEKEWLDVIRSLDKLEKFGRDTVVKELADKGVSEDIVEQLLSMIEMRGGAEVLKDAKNILKGIKIGEEGIKELELILNYLKIFKAKNIVVDFSLARGLDYYTGAVFEVFVKGGEEFGSVAGGGRYDQLIKAFGGAEMPSTGISLGIERILEVMEKRKMFEDIGKSFTNIFVVLVDESIKDEALKIVETLRSEGFNCDVNLRKRSLTKQLDYANARGIRYLVIVGQRDLKEKKVTVKDMATGNEDKVAIKELAGEISNFI